MEAIELLANHGIEVSRDGTILQDKSCKLYSDGQIHDFGRGGLHYFTAKEFLDARIDLHDAPIQASTASINLTPKYNLQNIYNSYKQQFKDVDNIFKLKAMHELLPEDYWHKIPDYIGYSFKDNSLTLSVFNDADVQAVTIRKSGGTLIMSNVKLYLDKQSTKDCYRLRVMKSKTEAIAIYVKNEDEAHRVKAMLRKVLTALNTVSDDK